VQLHASGHGERGRRGERSARADRFFVGGKAAFNESIANFVGYRGAISPYTLQVTLAHKAGYFAAEISRWPAWVVETICCRRRSQLRRASSRWARRRL